jgi:CelD/BcsL family acetyltransferase involved in cellulose biosynthesis
LHEIRVTAIETTRASGGRLELLDVDDPRWDQFVEERQEALAYHRAAWSRTLTDAYGLKSFCLVLQRDDGSISAGIPFIETHFGWRRWISLPFSDVCPPLGDKDDVTRLFALAQSLATARRVRGIEVRSLLQDCPDTVSFGLTYTLDLGPDADALLATFSKSQVQRNIARARRDDVVVRRGDTPDDLLRVYVRLHANTRQRLGVPSQPLGFFKSLWKHMIAPGYGFVLISYVQEAPAAAAVFLLGTRTVTYKYGASESAYWPHRPNHLLFWEAIRWSCESGKRTFDFGRSDWGNEGLRAFKKGWGTTESELVYSRFGRAPFQPPALAMSVLRPTIRHSPRWVNRALGRLLYRFTA